MEITKFAVCMLKSSVYWLVNICTVIISSQTKIYSFFGMKVTNVKKMHKLCKSKWDVNKLSNHLFVQQNIIVLHKTQSFRNVLTHIFSRQSISFLIHEKHNCVPYGQSKSHHKHRSFSRTFRKANMFFFFGNDFDALKFYRIFLFSDLVSIRKFIIL